MGIVRKTLGHTILQICFILIVQAAIALVILRITGDWIPSVMGAVLTGLVGFEFLLHKVEYHIQNIRVSERLLNLGLTEEILSDADVGEHIENLIKNISNYFYLRSKIPELIKTFVDKSIIQTVQVPEHIPENEVIVALEDIREYGNDIMDQAVDGDELLTTSYIYSPLWWEGKPGDNYMQKKINAARRNVKVTQIFISSDREYLKGDEERIQKLTAEGLEVYAAASDNLDRDHQKDLLLLKDKIAFELILQEIYWIDGFKIYFQPSGKLKDCEKIFDDFMTHPNVIKYDPKTYPNFADFVEEVFKGIK